MLILPDIAIIECIDKARSKERLYCLIAWQDRTADIRVRLMAAERDHVTRGAAYPDTPDGRALCWRTLGTQAYLVNPAVQDGRGDAKAVHKPHWRAGDDLQITNRHARLLTCRAVFWNEIINTKVDQMCKVHLLDELHVQCKIHESPLSPKTKTSVIWAILMIVIGVKYEVRASSYLRDVSVCSVCQQGLGNSQDYQ